MLRSLSYLVEYTNTVRFTWPPHFPWRVAPFSFSDKRYFSRRGERDTEQRNGDDEDA